MTAGRHGFDAWPMPSERKPPVVCPGKSKKRISKEQLGHASIQMTVDIYGHLIPSGDREAVNRLDSSQMDAIKAQPTKLKSP
jgi:integrase